MSVFVTTYHNWHTTHVSIMICSYQHGHTPVLFVTFGSEENSINFTDYISKHIFLKNIFILIKITQYHRTNIHQIDHHYDVIKWKHFTRFPLWGQSNGHRWIPLTKASGADFLVFSLICAWTNIWENNRDTDDLRRHRAHYDATVMITCHAKKDNVVTIFQTIFSNTSQ